MENHAKSIIRIIFGLGSNLGNRQETITRAVDLLELRLGLSNIKKSKLFANKALLKEGAPKEWDLEFLNLAMSADIDLEEFPAEKILEIIKKIEKDLGRKQAPFAWAPREIDIDILAIGELVIDLGEKLKIPHYALLERDFFVKTFAEIEPEWKYPMKGKFFGKKISDL